MVQRLLVSALVALTCVRVQAATADFNALTAGSSYAAPAIFSNGGLDFELLFSLGNLNVAAASGQVNPAFTGNYLNLTSNTGLDVNLPTGATQIKFDFIRNNSATAFVINGGWLDATQVPVTPSTVTVKGVSVTNSSGANWGNTTATGTINTFFIVGTDFLVDNFNVTPAPGVPGDYNKNHIVDAGDYVWLRKTLFSRTGYNSWRTNFGTTGGAGTELGSVGIPEPSALAILLVGSACASVAGRYRCARRAVSC
jgi:hypothetical protein